MMKTTAIDVFEITKEFVKDEKKAKRLVEYWEDAKEAEIVKTVERKIEHLATKEDLAKMDSTLTWKLFAFWIGQAAFIIALVKYVL